jgi:hypothetical protein
MVSCFIVVFLSYYPIFWSSRAIYKAHYTRYMFERHDQKLTIFVFSGCFRELLPIICGFSAICKAHDSRYMFERHDQTHRFCVFWPFL